MFTVPECARRVLCMILVVFLENVMYIIFCCKGAILDLHLAYWRGVLLAEASAKGCSL
jgi:hypothetical protein